MNPEPFLSDLRDGMFRGNDLSTRIFHLFRIIVDRFDFDGVLNAVPVLLAFADTAAYSVLSVIAGVDQPVFLRAVPFIDLPAEYVLIKFDGPFRLVGGDFDSTSFGSSSSDPPT